MYFVEKFTKPVFFYEIIFPDDFVMARKGHSLKNHAVRLSPCAFSVIYLYFPALCHVILKYFPGISCNFPVTFLFLSKYISNTFPALSQSILATFSVLSQLLYSIGTYPLLFTCFPSTFPLFCQ